MPNPTPTIDDSVIEIGMLPCPFCGSQTVRVHLAVSECRICGATGPTSHNKTNEDAVRKWNRRPAIQCADLPVFVPIVR